MLQKIPEWERLVCHEVSTALVAQTDRRQFTTVTALRKLPGAGESPSSLDLYLSWMSPGFWYQVSSSGFKDDRKKCRILVLPLRSFLSFLLLCEAVSSLAGDRESHSRI